ncbi:hypothetical protein QVD17_16978 [Tagetes erecta]|uniref:Uncharacterized protein n=1 Tax=Tagetes erecta TaxID=13708 RepID=A0AAD8KRH8_TARER|nr:hypothetical protein QVD17_16978 [Tagetes erecta]
MISYNNKMYKGVKRYWRRRGYRRLSPATATTNELRSSNRKTWSWKIRMPRRLKIKLRFKFNPKKFIARVQDAYVRMMMRVANLPAVSSGAIAGYGGGDIGQFGMRAVKEYDEKMIIQMYNSLVMRQPHLMALDVEPPLVWSR